MATEYKLPYTAAQIEEKLDKIDAMEADIKELSGGNANQVTLTSPDGSKWNLTVDNAGNVSVVKLSGGNTGGGTQNVAFAQSGSVLEIVGIDNIKTITQTGSVLALA